jgi:hypothetical protein
MSRPIDATTVSHLGDDNLTYAYLIRLDILGDPVVAWTGFGDLTFAPGATGDGALDGQTFGGITHLVGEISVVGDSDSGSDAVQVSLPGVNLTDEAMRQVVFNRNTWKFRQAWLWIAFFDDNGAVIGKPVRIKSGRMDQMVVTEDEEGEGTVSVSIESQQAYAAESLNTRYSEQHEIDPSDTSQNYTWAEANMTPALGVHNVIPGGPTYGGGSAGGGVGSYGGGGSNGSLNKREAV